MSANRVIASNGAMSCRVMLSPQAQFEAARIRDQQVGAQKTQ
jgi:hypothetical protein